MRPPLVDFIAPASADPSAEARVARYHWGAIAHELNDAGCAILPKLLTPDQCRAISALYPDETHFRSHIIMARHGFGKGEYRYFNYPLPDVIGDFRTALYRARGQHDCHDRERQGLMDRYLAVERAPMPLQGFGSEQAHCRSLG